MAKFRGLSLFYRWTFEKNQSFTFGNQWYSRNLSRATKEVKLCLANYPSQDFLEDF